jgi:hypothetical protein
VPRAEASPGRRIASRRIGASIAVQDKSWRVRYMVAEQFCELCEAFGPEVGR